MGWADSYIEKLQAGETVQFRPHGDSMTGKVNNGDLCTVAPLKKDEKLKMGDIVLCKVAGSQYLHIVKAVRAGQYLIGNNRGRINGWTTQVFGRLIKVEP